MARSARLLWRILVVAGAAALAAFSFASAVTHIVRDSNAEAALQFSPRDAMALSVAAESVLASSKAVALVSDRTRALITTSLERQAINPRALRQLGFVFDAGGDSNKARRLIRLAERVSRREFGAQLWLIEDGVRANDMRSTLRHYDTALRSAYDNGGILYPILTAALDDGEVQAALAPYIRNPPPWLGIFLNQAIGQGQNPSALAQTIMRAGRLPEGQVYRDFERQLLAQLAAKGRPQDALAYYLSLDGVNKRLPFDVSLSRDATDTRFAPISWQIQSAPGVGIAFDAGGTGNDQRANLFAGSGERGVIMSKLLFLAPGRYAISQTLTSARLGEGAVASWEINCLRGGVTSLLWRSDFPDKIGRATLSPIAVPSDCPVQTIALLMAGGARQDGGDAMLANVELRPLTR